jgi:hypothetical protein
MSPRPPLEIHAANDGTPAAGVGPGIGLAMVAALFPTAHARIRIATAYFTLSGYRLAREHIGASVQLHVLVGREEGTGLRQAVIAEICDDLARANADLWDTVSDLVERIKQGLFTIRDAREIQTPFHCKFYICDDHVLWHGSANYTKNGLAGNAEQASVSRDLDEISLLTKWYDRVAADARDLLDPLRQRLEEWLRLADPFDVYLYAIYCLYGLAPMEMAPEAHKPVYYQAAIVARALRQLGEFRGSVVVVATGLGKTVIGSEIAHRLHSIESAERIARVILVAPKSVHEDWRTQLNARRIPFRAFTPGSLFRRAIGPTHHQTAELEAELRLADARTLLILDEAHFARNQLVAQHATRRTSRVFRRLGAPVRAGARILLLTATPYGTNSQNLESLLHLLPDSCPGGLGIPVRWTAGGIEEFIALPVVTVLGFPHLLDLARKRGDVDGAGRPFIEFEEQRRYLPRRLKLRCIPYHPVLDSVIQCAFDEGCFAQAKRVPYTWADDAGQLHEAVTDSVANTTLGAWLSSPPSLCDTLERNLATLGGDEQLEVDELIGRRGHSADDQLGLPLIVSQSNSAWPSLERARGGYETPMLLPLEARAQRLSKLIDQLREFPPDADRKLTQLGKLIWRHCAQDREKAIIFVRRPRTALYLETELRRTFGGQIRIASTAREHRGKAHLLSPLRRATLRKRFSPLSHGLPHPPDALSVLVCTDADAEGVSLQDACVVINYDLPNGGDTLFQRAGRVLRPTADPAREIYFYTLTPTWATPGPWASRAQQQVEEMLDRLSRRHAKSASILRAPVLPQGRDEDKSLDMDIDTEEFLKDREATEGWSDVIVKSPADHVAILDRHLGRARVLQAPLHSARNYADTVRRVFVLVQHADRVVPLMFNVDRSTLETRTDLEAIDSIACEPSEKVALVSGSEVERLANLAIRNWCDRNTLDIDTVRKLCAVYLQPQTLDAGPQGIFAETTVRT